MKRRFVISVTINILAIALPVITLYLVYGGDHSVEKNGPGTIGQLLAIGGAAVFAFLCGLLSSAIMKRSSTTVLDVLRDAINENKRAHAG